MKQSYSFNLFADYFQIYLQDERSEGNLGKSWTNEAVNRLLALAPGIIGIGTARNMMVPVIVKVLDEAPSDDIGEWDQINECSIEISSGRIVISGCTDYYPTAARIIVPKGTYRVRIYYGKLETLRNNGLEGDDQYKVVLWPGSSTPLKVIKQRKTIGAQPAAQADGQGARGCRTPGVCLSWL